MTLRSLVVLAGLLVASCAASADEGTGGLPYRLDTVLSAGYRNVDVDGSHDKYREDYNLMSGGRLFDLDVAGVAKAPDTTPLDRFHLVVETPGDEPVSHYSLTAADRSLYDFRADFTRSQYFYAVPQLWQQPVPEDIRLDDLHDWNFERTDGAVDLTLRPPGLPTLLLGYRLYERQGDAISTVSVPGGDTFLVDAPVDTVTQVGRVGTQFRALGTDIFLQEEFRRVSRQHNLGPVLDPAGLDPTDSARLTTFTSDQDEHLNIPATTVRLRRDFDDGLTLTGAYYYSHAGMGFDLQRIQVGTSTFPEWNGTVTQRGSGNAALDTQVVDTGATYQVSDRVRMDLNYRFNERSQSGSLDELTSLGALAAETGDHVRVNSLTGEVEVEPRPDLSLSAGARWAQRNAAFSTSGQNITTDDVGAVGSLRWRPWSFIDVFARYESAQVDDPFTVPGDRTLGIPERQIALTLTNRGSAGLRLMPRDWVTLSYQLVAEGSQNDTYNASSESFGNSVALSVSPIHDLTLFASYTRRDLSNRANILIAPLYAQSLSVQQGSEDVFVTSLRWDFGLLHQRWSAGGDVFYVTTQNTLRPRLEPTGLFGTTAFDFDRVDGGFFLALHHAIVEPSIEFRRIDYMQPAMPLNDYRATIITFKLTKRWGF
jgi:hypothetical protein